MGGDHRLQCHEVADMIVRITSEDGTTFVGKFTNIRLVEGFGTNLMSCPRIVKAGWNINHNRRGFTVSDPEGRVLFTTRASSNGLHYLRGVQPLKVAPAAGKKVFLPAEERGDDNVGTIFNCARERTTTLQPSSTSESERASFSTSESERVNSIRVSSSTSESERVNSIRGSRQCLASHFIGSPAKSQPVDASVSKLIPLESLFKCSGSESLVECSNSVDLQHLYDSVGSQRSNLSVASSEGKHLDQVLFSALLNPLGEGLDTYEVCSHLPSCYFSKPCASCLRVATATPGHVVVPVEGSVECTRPAQ